VKEGELLLPTYAIIARRKVIGHINVKREEEADPEIEEGGHHMILIEIEDDTVEVEVTEDIEVLIADLLDLERKEVDHLLGMTADLEI